MLRQNPIKKKRGKLNIERHFLPPDLKPSIPSIKEHEPTVENVVLQPEVVVLPDNSVEATPIPAPITKTKNVTKNIAAPINVTKIRANIPLNGIATAMPDSDWRIGQYNLPKILAHLAKCGVKEINDVVEVDDEAADSSNDIFVLLNESLRKAREFDDKLFISIFETAIRASHQNEINELAKETLTQLQQIDGFNECYKTANSINEKWIQTTDSKLLRDSRIKSEFPLLMFPQACNDSSNNGILKRNIGYDFFVTFNGNGTVINPSRDFFDGLYQVGGVMGDVNNVVITGSDKFDRGFIERLKFYRNRQACIEQETINSKNASNLLPIQFFVPHELVCELSEIPNLVTINIDAAQVDGNEITISEGVGLSFQSDQLSLSLLTKLGMRWIRFVGRSGLLCGSVVGDILVFMVDGSEGLFSAVGLSKASDAGITIFDISQQVSGLSRLFVPVCEYIGAAAVANMNLVCEVGNGRFLDVVKGFESDDDVWSFYSEIDNCDDNLYYFSSGLKERFVAESADIIETFLSNRRRRHGLYFK
ncbi:MAG: hypothetical protein LBH59_08880 [Planctomycetaceae bacterium]|jgi:hypothetical protein|nr:hypothetical protein [Planctomycetaceae bacterium]